MNRVGSKRKNKKLYNNFNFFIFFEKLKRIILNILYNYFILQERVRI